MQDITATVLSITVLFVIDFLHSFSSIVLVCFDSIRPYCYMTALVLTRILEFSSDRMKYVLQLQTCSQILLNAFKTIQGIYVQNSAHDSHRHNLFNLFRFRRYIFSSA